MLIECAYFDPVRTAETGRKNGIISDARYRFERGVDPAYRASRVSILRRIWFVRIVRRRAFEGALVAGEPADRAPSHSL